MPSYISSRPRGNDDAGSVAVGSVTSVPPRRYAVTQRPRAPMVTAAAASPPVASTTPRRAVSPVGRPREGPVVDAVQPPQRGGRGDRRDHRRHDVQRPGTRAEDGEQAGDAGQPHDDEQARRLATPG